MKKIKVTDRNGFPVAAEIRDAVAAEPIFGATNNALFTFSIFCSLADCGASASASTKNKTNLS